LRRPAEKVGGLLLTMSGKLRLHCDSLRYPHESNSFLSSQSWPKHLMELFTTGQIWFYKYLCRCGNRRTSYFQHSGTEVARSGRRVQVLV